MRTLRLIAAAYTLIVVATTAWCLLVAAADALSDLTGRRR